MSVHFQTADFNNEYVQEIELKIFIAFGLADAILTGADCPSAQSAMDKALNAYRYALEMASNAKSTHELTFPSEWSLANDGLAHAKSIVEMGDSFLALAERLAHRPR